LAYCCRKNRKEGKNKLLRQNQTPREYSELNGFELRVGKFHDPNEYFNGEKMELRILHKTDEDIEQFFALVELVKKWLT
jgi:hypothetical protein